MTNSESGKAVGQPVSRIDGRLKVTGAARYSADIPLKNLAYATVIQSTVARGKIRAIDAQEAEQMPGVLAVITHMNLPPVKTTKARKNSLLLMQDDSIR